MSSKKRPERRKSITIFTGQLEAGRARYNAYKRAAEAAGHRMSTGRVNVSSWAVAVLDAAAGHDAKN